MDTVAADKPSADPPSEVSPVDQLDSRLLAARARAAILRAIFEGRFEAKLPNEGRLAEMLNVSRTTVRTALQSLERDGVVTRRRAIGTLINPHVRPSSLALQRLIGFDSLLEERGHTVEVEVSWHWGEAGEELASVFAVDPAEDCCLIEKRYRADGTLALAIFDAVPRKEIVPPDLDGNIDPSLFAFSERHCRVAIHHAVVEILPMVKSDGVTKLEIAKGTPFIRLHETHYSADGDAMAFSVIDADDGFIRLEVVRTQ
jgi:GntR family transcriptional regulator